MKIPVISLVGTVTWFSNDFLLAKLSTIARMIEKNPDQTNLSIKQAYFQTKVQNLSKVFQQMYSNVNLWLIKMQSIHNLDIKSCQTYEQIFIQVIFVY